MRLSADGVVVWERRYGENGLRGILSLAEGPDRTGLLLAGDGFPPNATTGTPLLAVRLASDGAPGAVTPLGTVPFPAQVWIRTAPAGYRVLYQNTSLTAGIASPQGVVAATLDRDGRVLERRSLDASIAVTWTVDGGYFSVGIPLGGDGSGYDTESYDQGGSTFHARRLDSAGDLVWDRVLSAAPLNRVLKVVQTADGGYAVLGLRQNR